MLPSTSDTVCPADDKEKHVIILNEKDSDAKFDQTTWATVVKGTLNDQLKSIPVDKSLLNKSGKGCLFFPNKQAQNEAKAILEPLFDVTVDSRLKKSVMPKIKVFDIDTEVYSDKAELKRAIIEKNPNINSVIEKDNDLEIILINKTFNFAILKVTPSIRRILINNGKLFLGMHSLKVRDHFQPLQCYACQQYGHKQGSPECKHYRKTSHTCLYCAGNHMSRNCDVKQDKQKHRCANCCESDVEMYKNNASHKSTSFRCPFAIKEVNALIKRTTGLHDNEAKKLQKVQVFSE